MVFDSLSWVRILLWASLYDSAYQKGAGPKERKNTSRNLCRGWWGDMSARGSASGVLITGFPCFRTRDKAARLQHFSADRLRIDIPLSVPQ